MAWGAPDVAARLWPSAPPATYYPPSPVAPVTPVYYANPVSNSAPYRAPAAPAPAAGGFASGPVPTVAGPSRDLSESPWAWAMSIPDVAKALNTWQQVGKSDDWLKAQIMGTTWWKTTSDTARQWQQLIAQDPATANQQAAASTEHVRTMAMELGVTLDPWSAQDIGDHALRYGMTDEQLRQRIMDNYQFNVNNPAGQMGVVSQQLQALAAQYLVPQSNYNLGGWTGAVLRGAATAQGYEADLKNIAKSMFPSMATQIDAGFTPTQIVDPYRQLASQTLEIDPTTINFTDPKWQKAIDQVDPKTGAKSMMSLSDWQTTMRTNPVYGYDKTSGARTQAADLEGKLLQTFGAV